jgi:hypothetical protein
MYIEISHVLSLMANVRLKYIEIFFYFQIDMLRNFYSARLEEFSHLSDRAFIDHSFIPTIKL